MATALLVVITVLLFIPGKARLATIRKHLLWAFASRILSMYVDPESDPYTKTPVWTRHAGTKGIRLRSSVPGASTSEMFALS
jgi:hypothetical protein